MVEIATFKRNIEEETVMRANIRRERKFRHVCLEDTYQR